MNKWDLYESWNPWHGCTKVSPGCKYCYVYRQDAMYGTEIASSVARKTGAFNLPVKRKRDGRYKIAPGKLVLTCFTSDFLLADADSWRSEAWQMIHQRDDCYFYFFTKRIDRLAQCLPPDWGDGYPNVLIGCTVENQAMADYRLPIFRALPLRHRTVIVAPILEAIDLSAYLDANIEEVSVGGESGVDARPCHYEWITALREQCVAHEVPFRFHQTGAHFVKDGRLFYIRRPFQLSQAHKANLDYRVSQYYAPETVNFEWHPSDYTSADRANNAEVQELHKTD